MTLIKLACITKYWFNFLIHIKIRIKLFYNKYESMNNRKTYSFMQDIIINRLRTRDKQGL